MYRYEKAKELLGREPVDSDEPLEALVGWSEEKAKPKKVESEEVKEEPKKKVKEKKGV